MVKVILIEDNADLRTRIATLMNSSDKLRCLITFDSVEAFLRRPKSKGIPDIILLDIGLPGISGIAGIPKIKQILPDVEIVILTVQNDPDKIFKAICAGASGYLLKDINFDFLETQLVAIHEKGGSALSPQVARRILSYFQKSKVKKNPIATKLKDKEFAIVRGLVDGLSYQDVAGIMEITIDGVRYHIKNIYKKLQVNSKAQVIKKYLDGDIQ